MILLRSLLFQTVFYLTTAVFAIVGLPVLLTDRHRVQAYAKFWTGTEVWLLEKICGTKLVWRGLENLPRGACLIAAKHQSTLETMALTTKGADFSYILKRELTAIPIFGWYLKGAGQWPSTAPNADRHCQISPGKCARRWSRAARSLFFRKARASLSAHPRNISQGFRIFMPTQERSACRSR